MASFAVEINDADVQRVMDAVCSNYGYESVIPNPNFDVGQEEDPVSNPRTIDNPENQFQFSNRIVRKFLSDNVKAHEVKVAKATAAAAVNATVDISDPQLP
jgi:hypothetical protein